MIKLCAYGHYAHRQPLAYAQIRAHCLGQIRLVEDLSQADIVALSHAKDFDSFGADLKSRLSPNQRLVLLSEEPFWDTVWGPAPQRRDVVVETGAGPLAVTQLNHQTSGIYDFDRIPYFLLTHHHFRTRYELWFRRNAQRRPRDWQDHFQARNRRTGFIMARRQSARYEVPFCLCNQRTQIAEACTQAVHIGQGWAEQPPRQSLPDWHLDKLLRLDQGFGFVGAMENTLLPNYVTEKIFDAYAVGAIPLYLADAAHRVHEIAAAGTWVNLLDTPPEKVPDLLATIPIRDEFTQAYAAQQAALADLFAAPDVMTAELNRLCTALSTELTAVLG